MTVGFDRTADCQGNHPSLTEFLRILTEHYWLCFDRTTSLTEHLGNLGFDRTVNGEMFCQKNVISRVFCHMLMSATSLEPLLKANINKAAKPALVQKMFQLFKKKPVFDCMSTAEKK